jgi:hypothetical protein
MTEPPPWPDDTFDLIFLPRFVEEIGRRAFADWTGTEATVEQQVVLLPELARATPYQRRHATELLLKHTDLLARPNPHLGADELFKKRPSLWPIAQRLALPKEAAPALHTLHSVRNEIIQQSLAGKLTLKIRRVSGGLWEDYQSVWWNSDRPNDRFRSCIIDPEYPFGRRPSLMGNNDHWIFAPREGIDQIVARLATCQPVAENERATEKTAPGPARAAALPARPAGAAELLPKSRSEDAAETETTRWQREPVIATMKKLYPPDGIRSKGISIAVLTTRINREPEFQGKKVSEDTVRLADIEIKAALKKIP